MGPGNQRPVYQFGAYEFDPHARQLRKHGIRIKLQEQPLRILEQLVEHPGTLITRAEIQQVLWPADTYVDFDNAINTAIRKLRDALGDASDNPRFLETVARHGYRFIAPVTRQVQPAISRTLEVSTSAPDNGSQTPFAQPRPRWRMVYVLPLLAVGVALAALVALRGGGRVHESRLQPAAPLTSYRGLECCPSFSPDGGRVAFAWNGPAQDNFDI
jgi:DNA-binding winged helix-turn-helix (wHTH) protein